MNKLRHLARSLANKQLAAYVTSITLGLGAAGCGRDSASSPASIVEGLSLNDFIQLFSSSSATLTDQQLSELNSEKLVDDLQATIASLDSSPTRIAGVVISDPRSVASRNAGSLKKYLERYPTTGAFKSTIKGSASRPSPTKLAQSIASAMKILSNNRVGTAALQLAEDGDLALLARSGSKALSSKSKAKASAGKKKSDDPECLDKATLIFVIGKKAQDSCKRNLFQRVFTFDWGCERAKAKAEASATSFGETCPVDEDDNGLKSKAKSKLDDDVEESESVEDGSSYDVDKSSDDKYSDSDAAYCKKNPKSKLCK